MSVNVTPSGVFIYRFQQRQFELTPEQMHHASPVVSAQHQGDQQSETWLFPFSAELADGSEVHWQVFVEVGADYPYAVSCSGAKLAGEAVSVVEDFHFSCGYE